MTSTCQQDQLGKLLQGEDFDVAVVEVREICIRLACLFAHQIRLVNLFAGILQVEVAAGATDAIASLQFLASTDVPVVGAPLAVPVRTWSFTSTDPILLLAAHCCLMFWFAAVALDFQNSSSMVKAVEVSQL